jgi:hypothetical protein
MKVIITPEQRQQIKQSAQQLVASIDANLPAKALSMSAGRISALISEAVKASRKQ